MTEMKLMDLAVIAYEMEENGLVDFTSGPEHMAGEYVGWYGIRKVNPFDNDNLMFLIGGYGGEANTYFYNISEYDDRIGDFCAKRVAYLSPRTDEDYMVCIGKMLADFFERMEGLIPEVITIDD